MAKEKLRPCAEEEVCVSCGRPVPEGRMLCPQCEHESEGEEENSEFLAERIWEILHQKE